ncbi:MAG: TldD/PmbA family protein [Acidobacteriota bacterium]|nr:TldD/PmbA family protein [Acidobacteriota bacterium]MDW3228621.1 TldD/PmbA family protein [Acidobacteriota bacterium]MDY0231442.1 TldD/PmbA family protein [Candidatus Saccharicenans sp.]
MKELFSEIKPIDRRKFLSLSLQGSLAIAASPLLVKSLLAGVEGQRLQLSDDLMKKAISTALKRGGDFADLYVENRITRSIILEEGKYKSAVFGLIRGAGVRVIDGDKTGYAYTDELTEEKIIRAAEVASIIASSGKRIQPVELKEEKRPSYVKVKIPLQKVADDKRMEIMKRAEEAALSYDPRIKMVSIDYYDEIRDRLIANSEGLLLKSSLPLIFFIVQPLAIGNNTSHMGRERLSQHAGIEMFDKFPPEQAAREAARESIAMLEAKEAPAGKMDVVIQNGWGGVLVHEAVGHPLEADNIARETGAFVGKLGKKVAADIFTMVDDGSLPNFRGTTDFDDEGTQMKRNVLIKDGLLVKYMTDILSAKQLKMERTGNGRRESFRYYPIPRMTNTFIEKGKDKPVDIVASTKSGLYVQSLSGGSVNPTTGVFNFTCREAYLIENGKKTVPVKGATLIGNCLDIITRIDGIGDDLDFGPGICGKGQSAEVTAGQPTVRIRGITVGGTRQRR